MLKINSKLFFCIGLASLLVWVGQSVWAQKSPDAIALRVVSNPEHYSPIRWYNEKVKLKGAPQQLLVDGYQAVRDGRTVYVDAANYDLAASQLYTNIYIISYNQEAENATGDIFGQILSHWRFNINLDMSPGNCTASTTLACINDRECPAGSGYCSSVKGEVVRNTRRLSDIADIETILAKFKQINGKYPVLAAGSYLANKTVSVWPSWQETLAKELATTLPIDPVNELGACPGFDPATCWNASSSSFAGTLPSDLSATTTLPVGSQAYVYRATPDGKAYTLSTTSVDPATIIGSSTAITGTIGNQPPYIMVPSGSAITEAGITYININAPTSQPLDYYIEARDPDGNLGPLSSWTISLLAPTDWTVAPYVWSQNPGLATTTNPNIRRIYISSVGAQGLYYFSVTVSDGEGGSDTRRYRVSVNNQSPIVSITPTSTTVTVGKNNLVTKPIGISAVDPEGNYPLASSTSGGPLPIGLYIKTIDQETWQITGIPTYAPTTATYNYAVTFTDTFGAATTKNYSITVANQPPAFASTPVMQVRVNNPYSYDANATDADGHTVLYQFAAASGQPAGFTINNTNGLVSGTPSATGLYNIIIEAYDGYGATTSQTYNLSVTTYCGDSVVQVPNDEGQFEDCDDANADNQDICGNDCKWTCQSFPPVDLSTGEFDNSVVFDDSSSPFSVTPDINGIYLKLYKSMSTPYLWVANSNLNRISKIRAFDGYKKTASGLDKGVWETKGTVLGVFPTGGDPSRTAVNAETGEVWVANRTTDNVTKLDIEGNVLKTCAVGSGPRGLAIEEAGDVWVANYSSGNMVKISGDDSNCAILQTVVLGGGPYGLAIDSNNNIWVSNRGGNSIQKYSTLSGTLDTHPALPSGPCSDAGSMPYGITVDTSDNIWVADTCRGVYKFTQSSGAMQRFTFSGTAHGWGRSRGVTLDVNGGIWIAMDYSNQVLRIADTANPLGSYSVHAISGGIFPIGAAGDSAGQVWTINYTNGTATAFDPAGVQLGNYTVNPSGSANPYTYSDMTGLNRAMLLRSGFWKDTFDSGFNGQHWGELTWTEDEPNAKTSARIYLRAGDATSTLAGTAWTEYDQADPGASAAARIGRYIELRIELRSRDRAATPVLSGLAAVCPAPKTAGLPGCVDDGSGACFGCTAACGGGSCTGTRIDNCGATKICTIMNPAPCPADCSLTQYLSCGSSSYSAPDRITFDMSALVDPYQPNNDWGYTTAYPKPSAWPAVASSGKTIAVAVSNCCYNGVIECTNGTLYKRYSSSTSMSSEICLPGAPPGSQTVTYAMSPYTFAVPAGVYAVEIEAIGGGGGGGSEAAFCFNGANGGNTSFGATITGNGGQAGTATGLGGAGGGGGGNLGGTNGLNGAPNVANVGGGGGNLPPLGPINAGFAYGRGGSGGTDGGGCSAGCGKPCGSTGGGGGGSAGYYHGTIPVTPGDSITAVIGAGGWGAASGNNGIMIISW